MFSNSISIFKSDRFTITFFSAEVITSKEPEPGSLSTIGNFCSSAVDMVVFFETALTLLVHSTISSLANDL
ncbi:hypothetical protein D3C71_1848300 [compost metagenome]